MEGILKVTPEKLIQTSGEFAGTGGQMFDPAVIGTVGPLASLFRRFPTQGIP